MNTSHRLLTGITSAVVLIGASRAPAASMSEYFNDDGTAAAPIVTASSSTGLSGGSGWDTAWTRGSSWGVDSDYTDYAPGVNLTSSVTGYLNTGNLAGADDGAMTQADQAYSSDRLVHRGTGGLDGTIWISTLIEPTGYSIDRDFEWAFSGPTVHTPDTRLVVQVGNRDNDTIQLKYDGSTTSIPDSVVSLDANKVSLVMIRITMNTDANGSDSMEVWVNPTDVTSQAAMGSPVVSNSGADVFGTTLDYIGLGLVVGSNTPYLDAIRVSNDAAAFQFVTTGTVPEPAGAALLALGALALLPRRRREGVRGS